MVGLSALRHKKSEDLASLLTRPGQWATSGQDLEPAGFRLARKLGPRSNTLFALRTGCRRH